MTLANDVARCLGHGAGPSGHQSRADCVNCLRRLAPRPAGATWFMEPPKEFPCPNRIARGYTPLEAYRDWERQK